jgi:hypothetical protein
MVQTLPILGRVVVDASVLLNNHLVVEQKGILEKQNMPIIRGGRRETMVRTLNDFIGLFED